MDQSASRLIQFKSTLGEACPWFDEELRRIDDPLVRLHNETIAFCLYCAPTEAVHEAKFNIFERIQKSWLRFNSNRSLIVAPFLSSQTYLSGTEIEIYVTGSQVNMDQLKEALIQAGAAAVERVESVGVQYDVKTLSCRIDDSQIFVKVLEPVWDDFLEHIPKAFDTFVEFRFLFMVFNCMLRQRSLDKSINSLLLFALISSFLYGRRHIETRSLTQTIIKFLEYFSVGNLHERQILYRKGGNFEAIESFRQPSDPNVRPGSEMVRPGFSLTLEEGVEMVCPTLREFFQLLKNRYRLLSNYNYAEGRSILRWLVNPCGENFSYM